MITGIEQTGNRGNTGVEHTYGEIESEIEKTVNGMEEGSMNSVVYDTAWLAMLESDTTGVARNTALAWLCCNQKENGSFGANGTNWHDKMISSTIAAVALKKNNKRNRYTKRIKATENFLNDNTHRLAHDPYETVGFEMLLPSLYDTGVSMGLSLPRPPGEYYSSREKKLKMIPEEMFYSKSTTLMHSIEFLGESIDEQRLENLELKSGAIGDSPGASSYIYNRNPSDKILEYINKRFSDVPGGFVCDALLTAFVFECAVR